MELYRLKNYGVEMGQASKCTEEDMRNVRERPLRGRAFEVHVHQAVPGSIKWERVDGALSVEGKA